MWRNVWVYIYMENRYFLCVLTASSPKEPQGFSALQICCVWIDFQLPQDVLGELESCRSAADMEEAISLPSPGSGVLRRQIVPALGPDSFPGTGRGQSREKTQMPVLGWRKGPPLSSRHSPVACKDHGDT